MKILFPFLGQTYGGSHASALSLIQELSKMKGLEIVVGVHHEGMLSEIFSSNKIEWVLLPDIKYKSSAKLYCRLLNIYSLTIFLLKNKFDIVHTNDREMHFSWVFPAVLTKTKFIWHQRNPVKSRRNLFFMIFSDAVISISKYCYSSLPRLIKKKTCVIQNPIELTLTRKNMRKFLINNACGKSDIKEPIFLMYVANWIERKRPELIIDLACKLKSHMGRKVYYVMVGEAREPLKTKIEAQIAANKLNDSVFRFDFQHPIEPWIMAADVMIAPARNEGLGRTVVEAMLAEVPVVASAEGGHIEVLKNEKYGKLFPPDDICGLYNKVLEVLEGGDEIDEMVANAKNEAVNKYSKVNHATKVVKLYGDVLND